MYIQAKAAKTIEDEKRKVKPFICIYLSMYLSPPLSLYIYIYIHVHMYVCIYNIYKYIGQGSKGARRREAEGLSRL